MDAQLEYLLSYLQEEFGRDPGFVVRVTPTVVALRSPDLPPLDEPPIPSPKGVLVRSRRREYFFPVEWVAARRYSEIEDLVRVVRDE